MTKISAKIREIDDKSFVATYMVGGVRLELIVEWGMQVTETNLQRLNPNIDKKLLKANMPICGPHVQNGI